MIITNRILLFLLMITSIVLYFVSIEIVKDSHVYFTNGCFLISLCFIYLYFDGYAGYKKAVYLITPFILFLILSFYPLIYKKEINITMLIYSLIYGLIALSFHKDFIKIETLK